MALERGPVRAVVWPWVRSIRLPLASGAAGRPRYPPRNGREGV